MTIVDFEIPQYLCFWYLCQYTNKNSKCYLNSLLKHIDYNIWPTQTLQDHQNTLFIWWLNKNKSLLSYFLDNFWQNRPYWVLKRQTVEVNVVGSFSQKLQLANYLLSIHHMINCFLRGLKSHFCLFLVDKWVCLQKDVIMYKAEFPSGLLYLVNAYP